MSGRRLDPDDRKALIVDTAARLLDERGFGDITVDDLREAAGLSKGGLYHHVRSKTDVLVLVCEMAAEQMLEGLAKASATEGTARERIEVLIAEHFDLVVRYGGALWAFFGERNRLSPDQRERVILLERQYLHGMKTLFDEMRTNGDLGDIDTTTLCEAMLGMVNWSVRWRKESTPIGELRSSLVELFLNGALRR